MPPQLTLAHRVSENEHSHVESSLLDSDCDIQELVGGDEPGHVMPHCGEGQDTGSRAVGHGLTTVTLLNRTEREHCFNPEINGHSISLLTYRRCRSPAQTGGRSEG